MNWVKVYYVVVDGWRGKYKLKKKYCEKIIKFCEKIIKAWKILNRAGNIK